MTRVAQLARYPVKSAQGERLQEAVVAVRGVLGDRGYGVVDRADGTVASGKHPRKWGRLLHATARYVDEPVGGAPLPPVELTLPDGTALRSDATGTDAALSRWLGRQVALTSQVPDGVCFEERWPAIDGLAPEEFVAASTTSYDGGDPVSTLAAGLLAPGTFLDLSPVHLMTTSTLAVLAELAGTGADSFVARRYRPNLLLDGAGEGFAEDGWVGRQAQVGGVVLAVVLPTMRCVMTTLAQPGLAEDRDTLRTVARHHRRTIPGVGTWACAGVYADVAAPGSVRVGDAVALAD